MAQQIFLCGMLGVLSYQDIRKKEVDTYLLIMAGIMAIILVIGGRAPGKMELIGGVALGMVVSILALLTRTVGLADGLVLMITGICLGGRKNCVLFFVALLLSALYGSLLLLTHKKRGKDAIAFLPFLLIAQMLGIIGGYA